MKKYFFVRKFIALSLLAISSQVHAYLLDGNDLYKFILAYDRYNQGRYTAEDARDASIYTGYIAGVYDARTNSSFCPPSNVKLRQALDIVADYIKKSPSGRQYSAESLSTNALSAAWPCR